MKSQLAAVLNEDGSLVIRSNEQETGKLTHLVDQLLVGLMNRRAAMQPPPGQEPQGRDIQVIPASTCTVGLNLAGDLALSLHHPALGLLSWELPRSLAQDLATKLQNMLDEQDHLPMQ